MTTLRLKRKPKKVAVPLEESDLRKDSKTVLVEKIKESASAGVKPTATPRLARILIIEDHPIVRQGIVDLINREPDLSVCGELDNTEEAFAWFEKEKPDLLILDISLSKGSNGIEFLKYLKSQYPNVKCLILSMHEETLYASRALLAGARGYVMKHENIKTLVDAIRIILGGKIYLSEKMKERMLEKQYAGVPEGFSPVEILSDRELEIFQLIGEGLSTTKIAQRLHRSIKTIETYRSRIKEKLNLKDNMELICNAVQWVQSK